MGAIWNCYLNQELFRIQGLKYIIRDNKVAIKKKGLGIAHIEVML